MYEETIHKDSSQSEHEWLAEIVQLKINWRNRCQRQIEIVIVCGDKPRSQADRKTVSAIYLSIEIEGTRIFSSCNPHEGYPNKSRTFAFYEERILGPKT